jgi:hypothetical protein
MRSRVGGQQATGDSRTPASIRLALGRSGESERVAVRGARESASSLSTIHYQLALRPLTRTLRSATSPARERWSRNLPLLGERGGESECVAVRGARESASSLSTIHYQLFLAPFLAALRKGGNETPRSPDESRITSRHLTTTHYSRRTTNDPSSHESRSLSHTGPLFLPQNSLRFSFPPSAISRTAA